jgi:uncharacterized membrane protein
MEHIICIFLVFIMAIFLAIALIYIINYLPRPNNKYYKQDKKWNKYKNKSYGK